MGVYGDGEVQFDLDAAFIQPIMSYHITPLHITEWDGNSNYFNIQFSSNNNVFMVNFLSVNKVLFWTANSKPWVAQEVYIHIHHQINIQLKFNAAEEVLQLNCFLG